MRLADRELRHHLRRLTIWSVPCVLGGAALATLSGPFAKGFATMTAGWAVVNLIIAAASAKSTRPQVLRKLREFVMLNLGLNLAYVGVGATLALATSDQGARGTGVAVVIQGLALFVLDFVLLRRLPVSEPEGPVASDR